MTLNDQILYYYKNGWRMKDIAAKLGLTTIAVKSRINRMRKKQEVKRWWQ